MNPNTLRDPSAVARDLEAAFRQAVIDASSLQHELTYGPDGAMRIVNTTGAEQETNGQNGQHKLAAENGRAAPSTHSTHSGTHGRAGVTYTLGEVAELTGLYPQYLLNLVERHRLVHPDKGAGPGARAVYQFTPEHVEMIRRFAALSNKGVKASKAAQMVAEAELYRASARRTVVALGSWLDNPARTGDWPGVVAALTQAPAFTEQERALLHRLEGEGRSLLESMAELGIRSEKEARDTLHSAYRKVGEQLFDALRTGVDA